MLSYPTFLLSVIKLLLMMLVHLIFSSPYVLSQSLTCNRAPYPVILAGLTGSVSVPWIEYNEATDSLLVAGRSMDPNLRGDTHPATDFPIIYLHSGPEKLYIWGKAIYLGTLV